MVGQAPDHLNREHPSRRLFSRLGRPVGRSAGTALSNFAVSHRLSPLKVSAFFKRTLRPPALRGAFFAQSGAHLFAVLCANRRTSAQTSRTAPICCIFLQQTPSFSPMGERPFSHPPTPSHGRDLPLKHFEMRVRLRRAWRAGPGSIREPLLQASCALRPSTPEPSFPYAH